MIMPSYKIEIEIFDGNGGTLRKEGERVIYPESMEKECICAWMYRGNGNESYCRGQQFAYPDDTDKLCPWLLGSIDKMIQALQAGDSLP